MTSGLHIEVLSKANEASHNESFIEFPLKPILLILESF